MSNEFERRREQIRSHFEKHMKNTNPERWNEIERQMDEQIEIAKKRGVPLDRVQNLEGEQQLPDLSTLKVADFVTKTYNSIINKRLNAAGFTDLQSENTWFMMFIQSFNGFSLSDFARFMNQTRANITIITKKLEANGYIERFKKEDDKKSIFLRVTDKWKDASKITYKAYEEINDKLNKEFGQDKLAKITQDLFSLGAVLRELEENK